MIEYTPILATHTGLFAGPQPELAFASIVAGNTAGRLWQIDTPAGLAALLWDKGNNVVYLAGTVEGRNLDRRFDENLSFGVWCRRGQRRRRNFL